MKKLGPKKLAVTWAKIIGIPLENWPGKCHEISFALVKHGLVEGKVRYGHWLGPVAKRDTPVQRHGWIELPDKRICDPTRYVFEGVEPYIYIGQNDPFYYDGGGNIFRMQMQRPAPEFNKKEKVYDFPEITKVVRLLKAKPPYCVSQLFWLANLPLPLVGEAAKVVYLNLIDLGFDAFIPIDNKQLVLE